MKYVKNFKYLVIAVILSLILAGKSPAIAADATTFVQSTKEIRYKNIVRQQWELSCAAAALATILRYQLNIPVSERTVALGLINRTEYISNPNLVRLRQGFSLLDLKRYVDSIGFQGVGLGKLELDDLRGRAPIIVPVNLQGYPHFVVFRGATQREVLLADPAFGNVSMSIDKFMNGWISYQNIERVGFLVKKDGHKINPGKLKAEVSNFFLIRRP